MMEQAVESGTAFAEYIALLLRLETLRQQGLSDSPEADDVRDLMDGPWYRLTAEEDERARGISGDLFMLTDEEVFARVPPEQREADWLRPRINQATEEGNHWRRLELFRHGPTFIDQAGLAFVRAGSYEQVGLPEIAVLFSGFAWRTSGDTAFLAFTIRLLEALGRWDEAVKLAGDVLGTDTTDAFLLTTVGETLLMAHHQGHTCAPGNAIAKARAAYRRAIRSLRRVTGTQAAQMRATARAGAAMICLLRGQRDLAISLWTEAIADWPGNPVLYVQRGAALYRVDFGRAATDLTLAIGLGAQIVQPYWYLANIALNLGQYDRCVSWCQQARRMTEDPAYVGRTFEWEAIAQHFRGAERARVLALFAEAERCLPGDETVLHNRDAILSLRCVDEASDLGCDGPPERFTPANVARDPSPAAPGEVEPERVADVIVLQIPERMDIDAAMQRLAA